MRINHPVTQREFEIDAGTTLLSTTDLDSRVTYANAAFLRASGFSRDEIVGQPHNIVRHPDMPREAFADMWSTLASGRSWTALVKNRRADGDFYWVRANATPIRRGGEVVGYLSVRTKPSRREVAVASKLYAAWTSGRTAGRALRRGLVVRAGALRWLSAATLMPVRWRLRSVLGIAALAELGAAMALGAPGAGAAMVALLAGIDLLLERQIAAPLQVVLAKAQGVAAGQAGDHVDLGRLDEIGMILRAVTQSGLNLRSLVDDVSAQMDGMRVATAEIAQGSEDLSSRTEQAAASLEETAASMEQLSATVRGNAESAREAARVAAASRDVATAGRHAVGQVAATMRGIAEDSRRISDIVELIDGIAFRTNILALNAAVEAASAGEHGRGFAVVASEVRTLAQRCAEAARDIRKTISASVENIGAGAAIAQDAGATMDEIVAGAGKVCDLVGEISVATQEQTAGIAQIGTAISQLDDVTQQNAALVEQAAAAARSLQHQAEVLGQAVDVFRDDASTRD